MSNKSKRHRKYSWKKAFFKTMKDFGTTVSNLWDKNILTVMNNSFSTESTGSEDVETSYAESEGSVPAKL